MYVRGGPRPPTCGWLAGVTIYFIPQFSYCIFSVT